MDPPTTTTSNSPSPEFEFKTPSSHPTTLLSADQLFSDGVLLPFRRLTTADDPPDPTTPPESDLKTTPVSTSKRWKDIFKKNPENKNKEKTKKKNSGNNSGNGSGNSSGAGVTTAELNINLWPFSRSRSAGNNRPPVRTVAGGRKVSSAPCSRSNSTGDKHRKWPTSPGRVGVHLGRNSPVWQAKRFGQSRSVHDTLGRSSAGKDSRPAKSAIFGAGTNVPASMGNRNRMGCQSDVSKGDCGGGVAGGSGGVTAVGGGGDGGSGGLFGLRGLFTKKVF